ncbi:MAG: nucleotidyltransferase family protein [Rhodospirillaceae bacterium]|nr:nucleotidyltransferase family protein [Rhodospirillaceae bacterium]
MSADLRTAMVLAAGYGTRLRPLTDNVPKPMVPVIGKPLIDHTLDRLADFGIEHAVVNTHHLADKVESHLAGRREPRLSISREKTILETGGGIVQALPKLGAEPFLAINAKIVWLDGRIPALQRLSACWDDTRMDGLLLVHPTVMARAYDGPGDFFLDPEGHVRRRRQWEVAPFVYTGIQILHPRIFKNAPKGAFSMNVLYDRAIEEGRLFGLRHDGEWFQVSTAAHVAIIETALAELGFAAA